jgi:hypothetical protein
MRVKAAHAALPSADLASTVLEAEPALVAALPPPLPFHLVAPGAFTSPYKIPAVVVAAVRVRQKKCQSHSVNVLRIASIQSSSLKKRKARQSNDDSSVRRKVARLPITRPFQLVSPNSEARAPPPLIVAHAQDFKTNTADGKKQEDVPVAIQVLPSVHVQQKTDVPNSSSRGPQSRVSSAANSTIPAGPTRTGDGSLHWHPGMVARNGITYIDAITAPAAAAPPPLLHSAPLRWVPIRLSNEDLPSFSAGDPTSASIQYLRYLAVSVGRLQQFPPRLQHGFNAEQRLYRERLGRALLARDGRNVEKQRPEGVRRSNRTRFAPDIFVPPMLTNDEGNAAAGSSDGRLTGRPSQPHDGAPAMDGGVGDPVADFDPADLTDVRLGIDYQAVLPTLRQRPGQVPENEAKLGGRLALAAGTVLASHTLNCGESDMSLKSRSEAIAKATADLASTLGTGAGAALGIGTMGASMAEQLSIEQQESLYQGMKQHDRDFFVVTRDFVPGVRPAQLAAYYYDVWKLRAVPAAQRWYDDRAAAAVARELEEQEAERRRQEEAARRAERQEAAARRRQVKEAVQWMRMAGKVPAEINYNKPVVRERANRSIAVLRRLVSTTVPAELLQQPEAHVAIASSP